MSTDREEVWGGILRVPNRLFKKTSASFFETVDREADHGEKRDQRRPGGGDKKGKHRTKGKRERHPGSV